MSVLWRPGFPIGEVGNVALKIAMLVALGNPRTLHHQRRALLHSTVARHRHAARRAIHARHQLPSRPSAKRAILQRHVYRRLPTGIRLLVLGGGRLYPSSIPALDSIRSQNAHSKHSALGKLWKEPVAQALACAHFISFSAGP